MFIFLAEAVATADDTGSNYLGGRFAFGNLSYEAISRCIELFAKRVMPAISREAA
jgi:hypothetical protein